MLQLHVSWTMKYSPLKDYVQTLISTEMIAIYILCTNSTVERRGTDLKNSFFADSESLLLEMWRVKV
jgi:hypothetical protein